jgi:hypothetical protein
MRIGGRRVEDVEWEVWRWKLEEGLGVGEERKREGEEERVGYEKGAGSKSLGVCRTSKSRIKS